jgi:hypothetical protein
MASWNPWEDYPVGSRERDAVKRLCDLVGEMIDQLPRTPLPEEKLVGELAKLYPRYTSRMRSAIADLRRAGFSEVSFEPIWRRINVIWADQRLNENINRHLRKKFR